MTRGIERRRQTRSNRGYAVALAQGATRPTAAIHATLALLALLAAMASVAKAGQMPPSPRGGDPVVALQEAHDARELGASDTAISRYLAVAADAWDRLGVEGPESAATAGQVYNEAVAELVELLFARMNGLENRYQQTDAGPFVIMVESGRGVSGALPPPDRLYASERLWQTSRSRGLDQHHRRDGLGGSLVAVYENRGVGPYDRYYPEAGRARPATAVIRFDPRDRDRARTAHLSLHDPQEEERIAAPQGGASADVPLAADFTAPLAYVADRLEAGSGFFHPDSPRERVGLYMLEPYDPARVPVLMVHGLRSNPLAWMEMTNSLFADAQLRSEYQVWLFTYPTAMPYLYAATELRDGLDELAAVTQRETGTRLADNPAVVVGHSMGGLLAKALVVESNETLWSAIFSADPERTAGPASDLQLARRTLLLEPSPYVARVVFVATPHRGSKLADSMIGRIGSGLAGKPQRLVDCFKDLAEHNEDQLEPEQRRLLQRGGPTSVRALSPNDPILRAFSRLPVAKGIPYHSIIGDKGREDMQGDGIVSYESAHLDGAASERIVPSSHDVYRNPLAIAEVERILARHAHELERP